MSNNRRSALVPNYKNKEDVQDCYNYREIRVMSYTIKLCEKVIGLSIRRCTSISKNQSKIMPKRSTIEAIYVMRQTEHYRTRKRDLHIIFIDFEKA